MSTKLFDITKQLDRFLSSSGNSESLKETSGITGTNIIEAHVQKRWLDADAKEVTTLTHAAVNEKTNCLNIVNVSVAERNRRKGLFRDFLELLEEFDYDAYFSECPSFYIRVDKVMNPVLDDFLVKNGYSRTKAENETHYSYYKIVRDVAMNSAAN